MRSPQLLRNGETPTPTPTPFNNFSTLSLQKLRRFNFLVLLLRTAAFCFSLSLPRSSWPQIGDPIPLSGSISTPSAVYSLLETGASVWRILKGRTPLPEPVLLWFDFGHDQGFTYLLLSASAAGIWEARNQTSRSRWDSVYSSFGGRRRYFRAFACRLI